MSIIQVERTIDAGHRVVGHKGKCQYLHGHTYTIKVELRSPVLTGPGFVLDFGDVKELIDRWDHKMLLWDEDPFFQELGGVIPDTMETYGLVNVPFNPTAENMASNLCRKLHVMLFEAALITKDGEFIKQMSRAFHTSVAVSETPTTIAWCELKGMPS